MHPSAYQKFKATRSQPIEAWERLLSEATDQKERAHMQIALHARRSTQHLRKADGSEEV